MSDLEKPEFPKTGSSMEGTETGYSVEARCIGNQPQVIAGTIYHKEWRKVPTEICPVGVPSANKYYRHILERGLFSYPAAQAIRWWLHAIAEAEQIGGGLCLETRIVVHQIAYTAKETLTAERDFIDGRLGR